MGRPRQNRCLYRGIRRHRDDKQLEVANATSSWGGTRRALPYAFTEHGAIMAATILNSLQAVKASLFVVRTFVQLRELLSTHHQLAEKLNELERRLQRHDDQILAIIEAIRQLMESPTTRNLQTSHRLSH